MEKGLSLKFSLVLAIFSGLASPTFQLLLDRDGKYNLEWTVTEEKSNIVFQITVETLGYAGLGISPDGAMPKSDIVVAEIVDGEDIVLNVKSSIFIDIHIYIPYEKLLFSIFNSHTPFILNL